jgi:hypothetical protein
MTLTTLFCHLHYGCACAFAHKFMVVIEVMYKNGDNSISSLSSSSFYLLPVEVELHFPFPLFDGK